MGVKRRGVNTHPVRRSDNKDGGGGKGGEQRRSMGAQEQEHHAGAQEQERSPPEPSERRTASAVENDGASADPATAPISDMFVSPDGLSGPTKTERQQFARIARAAGWGARTGTGTTGVDASYGLRLIAHPLK